MESSETYSLDEIIAILRDQGVVHVEVENQVPSSNSELVELTCQQGELVFSCYLLGSEPVFAGLLLYKWFSFASSSPFKSAHEMSSELLGMKIRVDLDDWGEIEKDDEGNPMFLASTSIFFAGGVAPAHIGRMVSFWIDDLFELLEVDPADANDAINSIAMDGEVTEMQTVDQISWVLSLDSISRTAGQLASFLMKPKQEVNSTLYRHPTRFVRDNSQPPKWMLAE